MTVQRNNSMIDNLAFDIGKKEWDDKYQGPWVSKTDVVQYKRCPYRVSLNFQEGIPYGDFLKPELRRFFFAAGIELETKVVEETIEDEKPRPASSIKDIRSQDRLITIPGPIRNHDLGIEGWPDMLMVENGRLLPVEIKNHSYVKPLDKIELALYWRLLEPIQQGPRDLDRKGYVVLSSGECQEVPLVNHNFEELNQLISEVRGTKLEGAQPKLVEECDHCVFKDEHLPLIYKAGDVSLVFDIGLKRRKYLEELGITTVAQLAETDLNTLLIKWQQSGYTAIGSNQLRGMQAHAKALLTDEPQIVGQNLVPELGKALLLDLEYFPGGQIFVVGVLVVEDGKEVAFHQKFAKNSRDEVALMTSLTDILESFANHSVVTWNGSGADMPALSRAWSRLGLHKEVLRTIRQRHVDLYYIVRENFRLPTLGLGLKDVAAYFGFKRTHADISSFLIPMKYDEFIATNDSALKQEILDHNDDDVRSLLFAWSGLRRLSVNHTRYFKNSCPPTEI